VVNVGEVALLNFYRERSFTRQHRCTCGEFVEECGFWSQVLDRHDTRIRADTTISARLGWLAKYLGYVATGHRPAALAPIADDDERLNAEVLRAAPPGTRFVCDASKDFTRLVRLLMNPALEVIPIHLVRDGRAVANSYARKKTYGYGKRRATYFKALVLWVFVNLISDLVLRLSREKSLRVSYDLFCRDPEGHARDLGRRLGIDLDIHDVARSIRESRPHEIGGNPMRFRKMEAVRLDERWREEVPAWKQRISGVLTAPFHAVWTRRYALGRGGGHG
jgi:hypothetical protein